MSIPYTPNSVPSWAVVAEIETRLSAVVSDTDPNNGGSKPAAGYIRFTTPDLLEEVLKAKAEEGVHIVIGDPQPTTLDGAGRLGKRTRRVFQVWLLTRSNQDRAGDVRIGMQKHLNLEDLVIDALDDTPPDGGPSGSQTKVGIIIRWIPGGEEVKARRKISPDNFVSAHMFEVHYVQRMRVVRSVFV